MEDDPGKRCFEMKSPNVYHYDVGSCSDSVELVPSIYLDKKIVSIGTYNYDENSRVRTGNIQIIECGEKEASVFSESWECSRGVLDVKWFSSTLGICALSDGSVSSISFQDRSLLETNSYSIDTSSLVLAVDICSSFGVASTSNGGIYSVDLGQDNIKLLGSHLAEAWTVTISPHQPQSISSGDDLGNWWTWDKRTYATTSRTKWNEAGICSIQFKPDNEFILAIGSYDKSLAIWDLRNTRDPVDTIQVGSGVWRLRWKGQYLLAACMYDGFHIIDCKNIGENLDKSGLKIVKSLGFDADQPRNPLAYGATWIDHDRVATCSFYNHQMQVWNLDA